MDFDWSNPYPTFRVATHARNVVATSHPLAAQAGMRILWQGGNAVDAIIATAAALTIVEPVSNGLGSDAFAILWDGEALHGVNGSGPAPRAWSLDYFRRKYGKADGGIARPIRGWDTVTVPGAVATWEALHTRFGRLPFGDLLQPAIELAERGYGVSHVVAYKWAAAVPDLEREPGMTVVIGQCRPDSRGSIHIKSAIPGSAPAIRPNFLSAQTDRDATVAGMQIARKIVSHPSMSKYIAFENNPGDKVQSYDEWLSFARGNGQTTYHVIGTCKMGSDPMAVVDDRLRVHGIAGLRVIDASIMPTVPSGNTNAPTIMVAEKGADMIKEDAKAGLKAAA